MGIKLNLNFQIEESDLIKGVWIIKPTVASDNRGTIWTSFIKNEIEQLLPGGVSFKHDKFSENKQNVLRGIHGDEKTWKLVTCVYGEIHQYFIDCRPESDAYLKWDKVVINENNKMFVLLPPGYGNAYCVMSEQAVYHYKLAYEGEYLDAEEQFTIRWDDPRINIDWPIKEPILSKRDQILT